MTNLSTIDLGNSHRLLETSPCVQEAQRSPCVQEAPVLLNGQHRVRHATPVPHAPTTGNTELEKKNIALSNIYLFPDGTFTGQVDHTHDSFFYLTHNFHWSTQHSPGSLEALASVSLHTLIMV